MQKQELLKATAKKLGSMGFAIAEAKGIRSFVDIIAQYKGIKLVVKISQNIDAIHASDAEKLSEAASFIGAKPIIIGSKSRNGALKRGVGYSRFSINCINYPELDFIFDSKLTYLASKSVGIKVMLDSKRLNRLRTMEKLTLRQLADEAGVSKSTLYNHEHAYAYASLDVAKRIEKALGGRICIGSSAEASVPESTKQRSLGSSDIRVLNLDNAPFGMLAKRHNYYAISYESDERTMRKKAEFFKELKGALNGVFPFFVSDSFFEISGIKAIPKKQLENIGSEDELIEYVY
ncbi:MAG: helix-turn-helix domain-containing protein [Candidatus Micrarchaeaceae archaeon]